MKRLPIILALIAVISLLPTIATADDDLTGAYDIEVVVLQNNLPNLEGGEVWSQDRVDTAIPNLAQAVDVQDQPDPNSDLTKALANLQNDPDYTILFHKRWVEQAQPQDDAELVHINNADDSLNGTIQFYLSRYLHLDVNLLLSQAPPVADLQSDMAPPTLYYRISQSRRVGPDEMQYFDHPKFGVIVSVKPVLAAPTPQ